MARRAALIIGNGQYQNANFLPNPVNDAKLIADSARKAGFDVVLLTDLTMRDFESALRDFRTKADGADVAMIYFAGHGIENGGTNWLVPIDAKLQESRDLRFEAIELDSLLETLQGARLRMVVLDACRNNPFGNGWRSGTRAVNKGLAETEIEGALVMYAAAGGQVAVDGSDGNSPFARSLAKRMVEPGLSIHRLGSAVLEDVMSATGGQQRPWTNMSIGSEEFYLVNEANAQKAAAAAPAGEQSTADGLMWRGADTANTIGGYQAYLNVFPSGMFAKVARDRIAALSGTAAPTPTVAAVDVPPSTTTAQAAPAPAASFAPPAPQPPKPAGQARDVVAKETHQAQTPAASFAGTPPPAAPAPAPVAAAAVASPTPATTAEAPQSATYVPPESFKNAPANGFLTSNGGQRMSIVGRADSAPLPVMPPAPAFDGSHYPACREDFQSAADAMAKIVAINKCTSALDSFVAETLNGFARAMKTHQEEIAKIYDDKVAGQMAYGADSQDKFYQDMMAEHARSNPDGAYFKDYDAAKARYKDDRAYLQDRYCFWTGSCGGYPPQPGVAQIKN